MLLKLFFLFMICLIASLSQSCARVDVKQIDVKQITYKALRQQDCRMNEPNAFCERGFSNEYQEYERMRQGYIRDSEAIDYRVKVKGTEIELVSTVQ